MKASVQAEATVSLNADDVIRLVEDGELSVDGVTLTLQDARAPKALSEYSDNTEV